MVWRPIFYFGLKNSSSNTNTLEKMSLMDNEDPFMESILLDFLVDPSVDSWWIPHLVLMDPSVDSDGSLWGSQWIFW